MLVIEPASSTTEEHPSGPNVPVQQHEGGEDEAPKWKGKGKALVPTNGPESVSAGLLGNELTVDWTQYESPAGLKDTADSKSDIVVQIIQQSIDKVKARIVEEEERRKVEDESKKRRQDEKLRQEQEKRESPGTPDTPSDRKSGEHDILIKALPTPPVKDVDPHGLLVPELRKKPKKHSLMNLFRRLNNAGERGESSTAGATHRKRDVSLGSIELGTRVARGRFVSELLKRTTSNSNHTPDSSVHEAEVECVSCLDDFSPKEMVKAPCHSYCKPCFLRLISTTCENEQQWPPKCCLNRIPINTIILNVDNELKQIYRGKAAEWDLPISDRIYCSHPTCSIWVRPDQINRARNVARCSSGHWTCIICRAPQHEGDNCPQDRDMMRTDELAEEEGWKRCYGCHAYVEHREACQHMTCRCGAEFCYVCGARWRTCTCSMEQLQAIKSGAAARRQAREDREAQELAEVQEAIRQVEEFEREEALKAELLRLELERLAEERRQKELVERIRREGERRRVVEVKYLELREVFTNVHELQRIIVQREHSAEEARLETQGSTALEELRENQKADREKLNSATKTKLNKRETELEREYAKRAFEESCIEGRYQAKLEAYWANRKGSEAKIEASMKELKRKMDDRFRKWEKWRDNELDNYRWSVKEQQDIREELMAEAERRLMESTREELNAFSLRKAAELRWVDVVIEERGRMLNEMEIEEIENGENIDAWFTGLLDDSSSEEVELLKDAWSP
ncbi:hypothetical protein F4677DRAFT_449207 [Hypoxylon crocopeplum]|nr:hypothetical protein F4677DRAFT_449207 [Hypoxylon crocopeplum]